MRVYDEQLDEVAVRLGATERPDPTAFVRGGRLYLVTAVLGRWRERRSWWTDALDPAPGSPGGIAVAARERHVWRVEARVGRLGAVGVFELVADPTGAVAGDPDDLAGAHWRVARVAD